MRLLIDAFCFWRPFILKEVRVKLLAAKTEAIIRK
jgi:hypothetical protein